MQPSTPPSASKEHPTVLLFAPNASEAERLTQMLGEAAASPGFRSVHDPKQLQTLLSASRPDVVILQGVDPSSDLFQASCKRGAHPSKPRHVIAIVQDGQPSSIENAVSAGAQDYLIQPVSQAALRARVDLATQLQGTRRAHRRLQAKMALGGLNDPMTGLANRKRAETFLRGEIERVQRGLQGLGIAVYSLDHFGLVNETFGNHMGDQVLADVGAALTKRSRGYDMVARWDGKIFLVAYPATTLRGADSACRRQMEALRDLAWTAGEEKFYLTASVGLAYSPSGSEEQLEPFVARAETAVQAAKQDGRDRISQAKGNRPFADRR